MESDNAQDGCRTPSCKENDDRGSLVIRYDQIFGFDGFSEFIKCIPRKKVDYAIMGLVRHRENSLGEKDDDDIVRQFGLNGMSEFWEIELSEPMRCHDFTWHLSRHFAKPNSSTDHIRAHIRKALRAARLTREPWFIEIPEAPPSNKLSHPYRWVNVPGKAEPVIAHVVSPDPPVDGIDLDKLLVRPREAVTWMLASAQRRYLVPPSLVAVLSSSERNTVQIGVECSIVSSAKPVAAMLSEQVSVPAVAVSTSEIVVRKGQVSDAELHSYVAELTTDPQLFCPDVIGRVQREFGNRAPGIGKIKKAYKDHYRNPVRPGQRREGTTKCK